MVKYISANNVYSNLSYAFYIYTFRQKYFRYRISAFKNITCHLNKIHL